MMIPTMRLPGGAALVAELAAGARSFAAGFWFPIGSRHEAPRERGFVHFVEHMAFKGSSRRSAADISREIDRVGGYLNAFTDRDSICLHCQVPASKWALALDVLSDMAFSSLFREADFELEREVIVSEILAARDDPEERSHDEFLSAIWPSDPLSRKIAGEPEDIRRITRDELYEFYKAEFRPDRLLVAASGSVDPEEVAGELGRLLGRVQPNASAPAQASAPRTESTPVFSCSRGYARSRIEQVHFYEAVQLDPPFTEDGYYALAAFNGALGEASSSRLFLSLREKKGLCYSVFSAFAMSRTECLWMASANVSLAQLPALASEMDAQLDAVAEGGLDEGECEDAASRLVGSFELALEDSDFRMRRIARQVYFSGEAQDVEEARSRMSALGPKEINEAGRALLAGRQRARFAYGGLSRKAAKDCGLAPARVWGARAPGASAAGDNGPSPAVKAARRG
jgi:predicted Zn-dependent peptidase